MKAMFMLGYAFGMIIVMIYYKFVRTSYGTLRIMTDNPEKDIYRIELDKLDDLSKKKYINLKVKISQD